MASGRASVGSSQLEKLPQAPLAADPPLLGVQWAWCLLFAHCRSWSNAGSLGLHDHYCAGM
jgi:hypothetical protein